MNWFKKLKVENLYHQQFHKDAREGIKDIMRNGFHQSVKSVMITKSGELKPVEIKSRALKSTHNKFLGTLTVVRPLGENDILPDVAGLKP